METQVRAARVVALRRSAASGAIPVSAGMVLGQIVENVYHTEGGHLALSRVGPAQRVSFRHGASIEGRHLPGEA